MTGKKLVPRRKGLVLSVNLTETSEGDSKPWALYLVITHPKSSHFLLIEKEGLGSWKPWDFRKFPLSTLDSPYKSLQTACMFVIPQE